MRVVLAASFCLSFLLTVVLVLVVRRMALRVGFVDKPGGRKTHAGPTALGGGIAIFLAVSAPLLAVAVASAVAKSSPGLLPVPGGLAEDVARAAEQLPLLLTVLAGGLAIFALGMYDDLHPLGPRAKLLGQFAVAIAVSLVPGIRITLFIQAPWIHVAVTAVWIVLMVNCFNLLDNMDGQSALVAFLSGGALLVLALQTGQYFIAGLLTTLLGALVGFLLFNLPPASIFMGDSGSMFIGYCLAVSTTLASFMTDRVVNPLFPVMVPLVIFAVPLYDALSVLAIRFDRGKDLLAGDRSHFSHRLMRLGMSDRMVLVTVALTVLATSPGATIPYGSSTWQVFVPAAQALAVILVIVQLELTAARRRRGDGFEGPG
jgi:UDP-GlcNAc:undecaprenyl-phosphate GlcNAc-1-phosphate transferase